MEKIILDKSMSGLDGGGSSIVRGNMPGYNSKRI